MRKIVVVLYGPPGAGKGTQARLLADKLNLINFDTGRFLESIWYDPKRQKQKLVKRERRIFEEGKLNSSSFVTPEIIKEVKKIAAANWGVIFSGSPRTMYEAEKEYPVFKKLYGKNNIHIFVLEVPAELSIKRNSARMVCVDCGYLFLSEFYPAKQPQHCPVCGGRFRKRTLDKADIIKVRLREYQERTLPILDFAEKRGYRVTHIDARPAPYKVMQRIYAHIEKSS